MRGIWYQVNFNQDSEDPFTRNPPDMILLIKTSRRLVPSPNWPVIYSQFWEPNQIFTKQSSDRNLLNNEKLFSNQMERKRLTKTRPNTHPIFSFALMRMIRGGWDIVGNYHPGSGLKFWYGFNYSISMHVPIWEWEKRTNQHICKWLISLTRRRSLYS